MFGKKYAGASRIRRQSMDMTEGSIARQLISFAFPLLIGNLFQQLYNTVDTWVVGNFVSDNAFAAVGSMGPIVNMFIGFFLGFATGAGALISQNFGAKNEDAIEKLVHTSIVATFVIGLIDLAVLYTFYCSGVLMLSVLFSALFFKEKLSAKNIIGCVVMSIALIFMMGGDTLLATWF